MQDVRFPIVIVANRRTGSSALCRSLGEKLNIPFFNEPTVESYPGRLKFINQLIADGNNHFVVKLIADQANNKLYDSILASNAFKIKLYRENKVEQISSWYLARKIGMFTNFKDQHVDQRKQADQEVDIDLVLIKDCCLEILELERKLNTLDVIFDKTIAYESLGQIENSNNQKMHPVKNAVAVKDAIAEVLNQLSKDTQT